MTRNVTRRDFGKSLAVMGVGGAFVSSGSPAGATPGAVDVERARRDTPGCEHVAHFNNAGAALPPRTVLDAVYGHLRLEAEIGGYEAADAAAPLRERTYKAIARLLGCAPDEIALVENATRGWDMAYLLISISIREHKRLISISIREHKKTYKHFYSGAQEETGGGRDERAEDRGRQRIAGLSGAQKRISALTFPACPESGVRRSDMGWRSATLRPERCLAGIRTAPADWALMVGTGAGPGGSTGLKRILGLAAFAFPVAQDAVDDPRLRNK